MHSNSGFRFVMGITPIRGTVFIPAEPALYSCLYFLMDTLNAQGETQKINPSTNSGAGAKPFRQMSDSATKHETAEPSISHRTERPALTHECDSVVNPSVLQVKTH